MKVGIINMEFIRKIKYGTQEELREILKDYVFELVENINGYKTYTAKDGYKKFELMEFPRNTETYSLSFNNLIYRSIKKEYVNIKE